MRSIILALALIAAPAAASPSDDLRSVLHAHWAAYLRNNPVQATTLGIRTHDAEIGDPSLEQADREAGQANAFLERLRAIPDAGLTPAERVSKAVLARMLAEQVEGNGFGARAMLFTTYSGWHQNFAGMAAGLPFRARADYDSYLARLAKYPAYNRAAIAVTREAVAKGYTQPCAVLGGFADMDQPELTRSYRERYFGMVGDAWRDWSTAMAQDFVTGIYASLEPTVQTVTATDAYITASQPPAALNRLLSEGRDDVLRALRCQERDRQAG